MHTMAPLLLQNLYPSTEEINTEVLVSNEKMVQYTRLISNGTTKGFKISGKCRRYAY